MQVGIKAAKSDLSKLIKPALAGEKVVITSHGKPIVKLVPEKGKKKAPLRGYGALKGVLNLPPGWDSLEAEEKFARQFDVIRDYKHFKD
jgi:prevent-host-death family protein